MLQFRKDPGNDRSRTTLWASAGDYVVVAEQEADPLAWRLELRAQWCDRPITTVNIVVDDGSTQEYVAGIALDRIIEDLRGRATAYQKLAASLAAATDDGTTSGVYVAVVRASACRDTELASVHDADPLDDDAWFEPDGAEVFVGVFEGTPDVVTRMAADFARVPTENVRLIPVIGNVRRADERGGAN